MRIFRYFCWLYVILVGAAILIDVLIGLTTQYGSRTGIGCNFYDALLIGVKCHGFIAAKAAELFLNWPLSLLYVLMLSFSSFWFAILAALLWFPPVFLLGRYLRKRYMPPTPSFKR